MQARPGRRETRHGGEAAREASTAFVKLRSTLAIGASFGTFGAAGAPGSTLPQSKAASLATQGDTPLRHRRRRRSELLSSC